MDNSGLMQGSIKQIIHLAQLIKTGVFSQYDYNYQQNIDVNSERYDGPSTPPLINLTNIPKNIPIALLAAKKDTFSVTTDVDRLYDELNTNGAMVTKKEYDNFGHFSFIAGNDMSWTSDVVCLLEKNC